MVQMYGCVQRPISNAVKHWRFFVVPIRDYRPLWGMGGGEHWQTVATGTFEFRYGRRGPVVVKPVELETVLVGVRRMWPRCVEIVVPEIDESRITVHKR